jgi:hypothetical protein
MTEIRGQKTEVRRQRAEDRGQKTEVRSQRSEVRRQRAEDRGQKTEDIGQKVRGGEGEKVGAAFDSAELVAGSRDHGYLTDRANRGWKPLPRV